MLKRGSIVQEIAKDFKEFKTKDFNASNNLKSVGLTGKSNLKLNHKRKASAARDGFNRI